MSRRPPARDLELLMASIATLAQRCDRLADALARRDEELAHLRSALHSAWNRIERLERRASLRALPSRPEPQPARVVTIEAAANLLDASTKHVKRLAGEGELELVDVRSADAPRPTWRVSVTSIEELLERRRALQSRPVREGASISGRFRADARKGG